MTGLHLVAYFGVHEAANTLIRHGQSLNLKDSYGQMPLSYAVGNGQEAVVKQLLEKGAELETRDNDGRTPLSWAAFIGHEAVYIFSDSRTKRQCSAGISRQFQIGASSMSFVYVDETFTKIIYEG